MSLSSCGGMPATHEGARSSSSSVYSHCRSVSASTVSGSFDACGGSGWAGIMLYEFVEMEVSIKGSTLEDVGFVSYGRLFQFVVRMRLMVYVCAGAS
jgi:hypothetical protein